MKAVDEHLDSAAEKETKRTWPAPEDGGPAKSARINEGGGNAPKQSSSGSGSADTPSDESMKSRRQQGDEEEGGIQRGG